MKLGRGLIQRFPSALLPFLQIKSSETPPELAEVVGPSLEMAPFYIADRLELVTGTQAGVTAAQTGPLINVPAGEFWWWIWSSVSASNFSAAGTFVQLSTGITDRAGLNSSVNSMLSAVTTVAAQSAVTLTGAPNQPTILPSGFKLFGANHAAAGGANSYDITLRALVARLQPQ